MKEQITGVVLAGGRGQRMGGVDKGLQELGGRPLVQWVLERLAPQVGTVLISANRNLPRYRQFGCTVLADSAAGFLGPLAGLQTALAHTTTRFLVAVPCDSPLLPTDLVQRLSDGMVRDGAELAVARTGSQVQRTFCMVRRDILPTLDAFLASGDRKVGLWLASLNVIEVGFDDEAEAFSNINTTDELSARQQTGK